MIEKDYIITKGETFGFESITPEFAMEITKHWKYACGDGETEGLNEYQDLLLFGLYSEGTTIIIAADMILDEGVIKLMTSLKDMFFIGSNFKFDIKFLYTTYGFLCTNVWDTEIADRRLYQGLQVSKKNPGGIFFNLAAQTKRYLPDRVRTSKDIRTHFIGFTRETYVPVAEDYQYLKDDICDLKTIHDKQIEYLKLHKKYDWVKAVSMPLVYILGDMELDGFHLNVPKWEQNIVFNKKKKYELELQLDAERIKLTEQYSGNRKQYISGGKYNRERNDKIEITSIDLFGDSIKFKEHSSEKEKYVNYSSDTQLKYLFAIWQFILPNKEGNFHIPVFQDKKVLNFGILKKDIKFVNTNDIGYPDTDKKISEYTHNGVVKITAGFTVGVPALKEMIKARKNHPATNFINLLEQYSLYTTRITNYGQNYLDKIQPKTGKIHTIYRQNNALNGRLQSGGGRSQPDKFNSQNVPRPNEYRECFYYKEHYIITADLSGAEVVIMSDKAQDASLKNMHEGGDTHSPVAQLCWRNIYLYRAGVIEGLWITSKDFIEKKHIVSTMMFAEPSAIKLYELSETFIINKTLNKDKRGEFKAITFGVVYGAYAKKIARTLNVSIEEGEVIIHSIKAIIPMTFIMVENVLREVFGVTTYGGEYLQKGTGKAVFNTRSHNSIIIPPLFRQERYGIEPEWKELQDWKNTVRNITISGTQADMIKEAMVVLYKFIQKHIGREKCGILIQVHDELVVRVHKSLIDYDVKFPYKEEQLTVPEIIGKIMVDTANKYLSYIEMEVDYEIKETWVK